jgi:hypothetical protein
VSKGKRWTEEQDAVLRKYWPDEKQAVSQRFADRSYMSCYDRARVLGLVTPRHERYKKSTLTISKEPPAERKMPPLPFRRKLLGFNPTPCSERELGYDG